MHSPKKKTGSLLFVMLLFILFFPIDVKAGETDKTIKVGYPIQEGLTEKTQDGDYRGYTYDYLMTIAGYTGIKFEFVEMDGDLDTQILTCLEMLEKGEIDVLGGMAYSEELAEKYDYVMNHYGTYGKALYVAEDNISLNGSTIYSAENIKVAVYGEKSTEALEKYARDHNLDIEMVAVDSLEGQMQALEQGEADAILGITLNKLSDGLCSIREFDEQPFYFAVTKGNLELVRQLNAAIAEIHESNSTYDNELMKKYFSDPAQIFSFTEEEKQYIQSLGRLDVLFLGENAPIAFENEDGKADGIATDVLTCMEEQLGIELNIIIENDISEYEERIRNKEPDIVISCSEGREVLDSLGYQASRSFLTIPNALVMRIGEEAGNLDKKREAVSHLTSKTGESDFEETARKCLAAVEQGEADYAYINAYTANYYSMADNLQNIYVYLQPEEYSEKLVIGINEDLSHQMLPVINKFIHNILEENIINEYLYKNIIGSSDISIKTFVKYHKAEIILAIISAVVVLLFAGVFYRYLLEKRSKAILLHKSRFDSLTGCHVRYAFREEVRKRLEKTDSQHKSLYLMIDIDYFKRINDTFGHAFGDYVLKEIAAAIMEVFGAGGVTGRLGGDEFAVFVTDENMIQTMDEKFRLLTDRLNAISVPKEGYHITVSMGGVVTEEKMDSSLLYEMADKVMYQVKKNGRGNYKIVNSAELIDSIKEEEHGNEREEKSIKRL